MNPFFNKTFPLKNIVIPAAAIAVIVTLVLLAKGNPGLIPLFCLLLAQTLLAAYVFRCDPANEINLSFSLFCFSLSLWTLSAYMVLNREGPGIIFWDKFIFIWSILIPAFFAYFAVVFPKIMGRPSKYRRLLIFILPLLFIAIIPTNLIIRDVVIRQGNPLPLFGAAYPWFMLYFISYILYGILATAKKYRASSGATRQQIQYMFIGLFLTFLFAIIASLVLPAFGQIKFFGFGPYSTLFFLAFTAYAILKHRLMSIEIVIQRSSVYAAATILIMAFYALAVMVSEIYLRNIFGYSSAALTAAAALVIAVIYQPMVRGFQNLTDRLFFRGRYDYQKTLRRISREIASVIRLEELTKLIASSFVETMKVSEISFLLPDKEKEHFRSLAINVPRYKKIEIDLDNPIIAWLKAVPDVLALEEIEDELGRQETRRLSEVKNAMERMGIPVWVPIISKKELIGVIALGNKLSGDVFTSEDLALLNTLADQTAVALDNARLYDEVLSMKNYSEEILQSMTNGVLTADNRGRIVTFNYMAERITGRKMEDVVGRACEEIWGKRGAITAAIESTLKGSACVNFEAGIASPERGMVPISFSSTQLSDSQGKKRGALLSIHDLSEMKELEDKIRRADKLTALATMAAGMAHEIKNPLSSMKVFAQLLPKKINEPEYRKKLEEILPREIDRIDRIVESLLGFARSTAPNFENTKIEELLDENLEYYLEKAKSAGVKIEKNYAHLPGVEIDRSQMGQVFSNLILNGIQAMPGGGELLIETLRGPQSIKIKISDTGHGITAEMQKKLFDPFFTTKYGGTGLGLTIAHSIVDGHKGFINVESRVGKGTTFTVTLPVSQGLL